MNLNGEKQVLEQNKTIEEKAEPELNSATFNMEKNVESEIRQKYRTIFNCSYSGIIK